MRRERDMDLIRSLMLEIEDGRSDFDPDSYPREEWSKVSMHLKLIEEAEFVTFFRSVADEWSAMRVTGKGHDFLDSVRDPDIWDRTKAGAEMVGGFTADTLLALAKGFIKQKLQKHTGVEVDL